MLAILLVIAVAGCGEAAGLPRVCQPPATFEHSPGAALEGAGWHRLYVQGATATPDAAGRFGMTERRVEVLSADHFLLSPGALVEFVHPLAGALTGAVFLHIARTDDPGVVGRYELEIVDDRGSSPILRVDDGGRGGMGYQPYEACLVGTARGAPASTASLLLRVTNLTGGMMGIVSRSPDYFTWVELEVE